MIGQTISHYKITEKLGEGGMGVVYKAQDTKLDRPVALKFLAPHLLRDEEGRKRFEREAKAAAKLDHPNICTVYEIDEVDGRTFIVMAFLEGQPLSEKIDEGPLKLPEALSIVIQMADGLEAAHGKGITHRDIKPDNVMLMSGSRGLVKLMDFGLAQLAGSSKFTREGTTLGTVNYMSPEQAEGAPTGQATDIWSLGVVLYEMVAGQKPFRGDFDQAIVYSIMNEPAEPLTAVRTGVPKELERVVNKCLGKKPEQRYHHVDELLGDLQAVRQELEPQPSRVAATAAPGKRTSPALLGVAAVVVAGALGLGWWFGQSESPAVPLKVTRLTSDSGLTTNPALSADGNLLAYASDRSGEGHLDIWLRQMGGGEPVRLTEHPNGDYEPEFSPDGTEIAFRSDRAGGGIWVIPTLGGEPRKLVDRGRRPRWSHDGKWIAYWEGKRGDPDRNRTFVSPSMGGSARVLGEGCRGARWPLWSPNDRVLLFEGLCDGKRDWWAQSLDGDAPTSTGLRDALDTEEIGSFFAERWERDYVIGSASAGSSVRNLWRVPISADSGKPSGRPERLTYGTNSERFSSLDSKGRIAYSSSTSNADLWLLPIQTDTGQVSGDPRRLTRDAGSEMLPALSPDGRTLVFTFFGGAETGMWLRDLESGRTTRLTASEPGFARPIFTFDGSKVAYVRGTPTNRTTFVVSSSGGTSDKLCDDCQVWDFTADGRLAVYGYGYARTQRNLGLLDTQTRETMDLVVHPTYSLYAASFSPNDRWVVFTANLSANESRVYVIERGEQAVPESRWIQISDSDTISTFGKWSPNGETVYFISDRDGFRCIWSRQLDAASMKPVGDHQDVYHSHGARFSLQNVSFAGLGLALGDGKLIFSMRETTGNIWLAETQDAQ